MTEQESYNLPDFNSMAEAQIVAFVLDEADKEHDRYYWPALNWRIIKAIGQDGLRRIFVAAFGKG